MDELELELQSAGAIVHAAYLLLHLTVATYVFRLLISTHYFSDASQRQYALKLEDDITVFELFFSSLKYKIPSDELQVC